MGIKDKGTEITDLKNKSELILETKINAKPHPTERLNRRYLEKGACTITAVGDTCTTNSFYLYVCLALQFHKNTI